MDKEFYFLIVIHFHQPVGNFDSVIERACTRCYEPFLDTTAKFSDIKFNLHYSGCLLEWFKKHRPAILDKIKKLIRTGQIELLGGGFYEPILSELPPEDSLEQIKMLSQFLKDEFGVDISGAWLAERLWEPHLAGILQTAGIRYTIVDDTHLRYSGLNQSQLYGYYITEENGKCLSIFPSDKFLRYAIPFHPQQESMDYILKVRDEHKKNCVLYGDDGEKFGEWPGTNEWVYKKKWLYNFLKVLRDNASWLKTRKISDYMHRERPKGRIYLPTASYQEMSEWALPAESAERFEDILEELKNRGRFDNYIDFIRGGFWRNFLVKYPESNQMHKRTLLVSKRLRRLQAAGGRLQVKKIHSARRELFRSQCNCAYWHGIFGGIYLYHLRSAIYKHLISADRILDAVEHKGNDWIRIDNTDFDCDGQKEFIVNTPRNAFIIDIGEGGTITEWDIKEKSLNIVNTISRRREAYHRKFKHTVSGTSDRDTPSTIHDSRFSNQDIKSKQLYYDSHRRVLFIDHFLPDKLNLKQVSCNLYQEQGDFIDSAYRMLKVEEKDKPYIEIERKGTVNQKPLRLIKRFSFYPQKNRLRVRYELVSLSRHPLVLHFAPELNFSLTQDDINEECSAIDSLILYDKIKKLNLELNFSEKAQKVFRFCVCTVSQSERGLEENYQASCILPVFRFKLGKEETKAVRIDLISS